MIYGLLVFTKARENFICILDTRIIRAFLVVDNDNNNSKLTTTKLRQRRFHSPDR